MTQMHSEFVHSAKGLRRQATRILSSTHSRMLTVNAKKFGFHRRVPDEFSLMLRCSHADATCQRISWRPRPSLLCTLSFSFWHPSGARELCKQNKNQKGKTWSPHLEERWSVYTFHRWLRSAIIMKLWTFSNIHVFQYNLSFWHISKPCKGASFWGSLFAITMLFDKLVIHTRISATFFDSVHLLNSLFFFFFKLSKSKPSNGCASAKEKIT